MSEPIKFYQNNPCVIVRSIAGDLAEVVISHHFAGDMELTGQCEACNIGDSDNKLSCTCDEHSWIIEEVQNEENRICVMVEKRLLTDKPIEHLTLIDLHKQVVAESESLNKTKELHEEWRLSIKGYGDQLKAIKAEIASLELSRSAEKNLRDNAELGAAKLQEKYDKMLVVIGYMGTKITQREYDELVERDSKLRALEAGGVENWEWYDESLSKINNEN